MLIFERDNLSSLFLKQALIGREKEKYRKIAKEKYRQRIQIFIYEILE
jgi:hypothetical protein